MPSARNDPLRLCEAQSAEAISKMGLPRPSAEGLAMTPFVFARSASFLPPVIARSASFLPPVIARNVSDEAISRDDIGFY